jgi:RES domain-containing protein
VSRYARARIEARLSAFEIFDAHRVFGASRMPLQVYFAPSRFCDGKSGFALLYAALSFETCILETVVRDRFVHRQRRELPLAAFMARGYARISTQADQPLKLLDIRDSGSSWMRASSKIIRGYQTCWSGMEFN